MDLVNAFLFVLPAYFANSAPVLSRGKTPVDLGSKGKTNRVFGQSKTLRGLVFGVAAGSLIALLLSFTPFYFPLLTKSQRFILGFLTSVGALAGDLLGSFVKRRLKITSSSPSFLLDQLPFLYFAIIFASAYQNLGLDVMDLVFLTLLTLVIHPVSNYLAHAIGLKSVPW